MKYFIFVLMVTLLVCCNKKPTAIIPKPTAIIPIDSNDIITFKSQLIESDDSVPYYQCDEYVPFTIKLTSNNVDSLYRGFFKCSIKPIINEYDSTLVDTIYTYSNQKNEIKIYKAKHGDFLFLYDVTDTIFELNGNIKLRMTKERFARKFNIVGLTMDIVDIGNLEQTSIIRFFFKNDMLYRINYEPYFE